MYHIRKAEQLSSRMIETLKKSWGIADWENLSEEQFISQFSTSDFHLLEEGDTLLSVLRIKHDFAISYQEKSKTIAEMGGLLSLIPGKGYGKELLTQLLRHLAENHIECIGFCFAHNRGFYQKCGIEVLEGKGSVFAEIMNGVTVTNEDDDVINLTLSPEVRSWILSATQDNPIIFTNSTPLEEGAACPI